MNEKKRVPKGSGRNKSASYKASRRTFKATAVILTRSIVLTGNQTIKTMGKMLDEFWSSVVLTGNQTKSKLVTFGVLFWSSVVLTGNQSLIATNGDEL